jgi:predicted O-methyltransferase YrrM
MREVTPQALRDLATLAARLHGSPDDPRPGWLREMNSHPGESYYTFLLLLAERFGIESALEIGTRTGAGALHLASGGASVTTIDIDPGCAPRVEALARERGLVAVKGLTGDSSRQELRDRLAAQKFDLVFIDGNHTRASVLADVQNFLPLLRPGGVLLVDDTRLSAEMTRAWNEIGCANKMELPELHYMGFGVAIAAARPMRFGVCALSHNAAPMTRRWLETLMACTTRAFTSAGTSCRRERSPTAPTRSSSRTTICSAAAGGCPPWRANWARRTSATSCRAGA